MELSFCEVCSKEFSTCQPSESRCTICFGLLNEEWIENCCKCVSKNLRESGYDSLQSFHLAINFPVSCLLRNFLISSQIPSLDDDDGEKMRNRFKKVYCDRLERHLELKFETKSNFLITLEFSNSALEASDINFLKSECDIKFNVSAGKKRRAEGETTTVPTLTKAKIIEIRNQLTPEMSAKYPWKHTISPCTTLIELNREPIFLGGRYCKYSRFLPQSPWLEDNGERKVESSVTELICELVWTRFKADSYRFSASGREDIDVRMLGNGRPFSIQLINPKLMKSLEILDEIMNDINNNTIDIKVTNLRRITRSQLNILKDGEENKTKRYTALCISPDPISLEAIEKLSTLNSVQLNQKTPIRVLRRRPLATRKRIVSNFSTLAINDHLFQLQMTTQAGTYVKEFVHGDFGRTRPCLGDLLGTNNDLDILELDVEEIDMKWPPDGSNDDVCDNIDSTDNNSGMSDNEEKVNDCD